MIVIFVQFRNLSGKWVQKKAAPVRKMILLSLEGVAR